MNLCITKSFLVRKSSSAQKLFRSLNKCVKVQPVQFVKSDVKLRTPVYQIVGRIRVTILSVVSLGLATFLWCIPLVTAK